MPVPDFAHGIQISFLDTASRARMQAHAQAAGAAAASDTPNTAAAASDPPLTFDDLLDVVNPLQHLPIVGTLYRHFTHDEIKPLPKIAGDTLYGGWMGLASSVADYAFERLTGKNFGDTVLALVTGDDTSPPNVAMASAAASTKPDTNVAAGPAKPAAGPVAVAERLPLALSGANPPVPTIDAATLDAFMTAVNSKGIPTDLGQRTLDAYRRTLASQKPSSVSSITAH